MALPAPIACNAMAWVLTDGNPWWPVFVLDPAGIPPELKRLEYDVESADAPGTDRHLVFHFGRHTISIHAHDTMKSWNCPEHPTLLRGHPMSAFRKRGNIAEFRESMKEAKEFDATDVAARRLLPHDECDVPSSPSPDAEKANDDPATSNDSTWTEGEVKDTTSSSSSPDIHRGSPTPSEHVETPCSGHTIPGDAEPQSARGEVKESTSPTDSSVVDGSLPSVVDAPHPVGEGKMDTDPEPADQGAVNPGSDPTVDIVEGAPQDEPSGSTEEKCDAATTPLESVQDQKSGSDSVSAEKTALPCQGDATTVHDGASGTLTQAVSTVQDSCSAKSDVEGIHEAPNASASIDGQTKCVLEPGLGPSGTSQELPLPSQLAGQPVQQEEPQSSKSSPENEEDAPQDEARDSPDIAQPSPETPVEDTEAAAQENKSDAEVPPESTELDVLQPEESSCVVENGLPKEEEHNHQVHAQVVAEVNAPQPCDTAREEKQDREEHSNSQAQPEERKEPLPSDESSDEKVRALPAEETIADVQSAQVEQAPPVGAHVTTENPVVAGIGCTTSPVPPTASVRTESPRRVDSSASQEFGRAIHGGRQFTNALADPELMAMADVLGISIEAHTPTGVKNIAPKTGPPGSEILPNNPLLAAPTASVPEVQGVPEKSVVSTSPTDSRPVDPTDDVGVETMAWAKRGAGPWWPSYVCDPNTVRTKLKLSGQTHNMMLYRIAHNTDVRLIYFFGAHVLGSTKLSARRLKAWNCTENAELANPPEKQFKSQDMADEFHIAVTEAQAYFATEEHLRALPALAKTASEVPKPTKRLLKMDEPKPDHGDTLSEDFDDEDDDDEDVPVDDITPLPVEVVAWARSNNGPYWPVYLCDPAKLRSSLRNLGNRHASLLARVRKYPQGYRLVYVFGKHGFELHKTSVRMKAWNCPDQLDLMQGEDSGLRHEELFEDFSLAVIEAEEFLGADESTRTLPLLTKTDMGLAGDDDDDMVLSTDATVQYYDKPDRIEHGTDEETLGVDVSFDCLAWGRSRGYPWWPAYVCDPHNMRQDLIALEGGVPATIYAAKRNLSGCRLVYYFGRRTFGLLKSRVRPWDCDSYAMYCNGHPTALLADPAMNALFLKAKIDALAFLVRPESAFLPRPPQNLAMLPSMLPAASDPTPIQLADASVALAQMNVPTTVAGPTTGRKRGRPPKVRDASCPDLPPSKRGRPVAIAASIASTASNTEPSNALGELPTPSQNSDDPAPPPESNDDGVNMADTNEAFSNEDEASDNEDHEDVNAAYLACGFVAWTRPPGSPWWPVFVCDPTVVRENLFHLGDVHRDLLEKAKADSNLRLVYYFGMYKFGLVKVNGRIPNLKVWKCRDFKKFVQGYPVGTVQGSLVTASFYSAVQEAQAFVAADENDRLLPRMVPSDMNPLLDPPPRETSQQPQVAIESTTDAADVKSLAPKKRPQPLVTIPYGQVVWSKPPRSPWWPVFVIDPWRIRHNLHHLGKQHRTMLAKAQQNPTELRLVYYFGRYIFGLVKLSGKIKPWQCVEHDDFLHGYPESAMDSQDVVDEFYNALKEAEDYLSADEETRLLPFFDKSDMQLDLEPPSSLSDQDQTSQSQPETAESDQIAVAPTATSAVPALPTPTENVHPATAPPNDVANDAQPSSEVQGAKLSDETQAREVEEKAQDGAETSTEAGPSSATQDYFDLYTTQPIEVTRNIPVPVAEFPTTAATIEESISESSQVNSSQSSVEPKAKETTSTVVTKAIPLGSLCWARWNDGSWWPAYVCDHHNLRETLHNLGTRHHYDNKWIQVKKAECAHRLVYYFGRYCFGLQKKSLQLWKCADHNTLLLGHGQLSMQKRDVFLKAIQEAEDFEMADPNDRLPPHMVPSDIDPSLEPPPPETAYFVPDERSARVEKAKPSSLPTVTLHETHPEAKLDTIAWAKSDGYPWWPVYICDPEKVKHTLFALGNGHDQIYHDAVRKPNILRAVYFFGSRRFGLSEVHPKAIQAWNAENHAVLLDGVPKKLMSRKGIATFFAKALEEANEFIESNEPVFEFPEVIDEVLQHDKGGSNSSQSTDDAKEIAFDMPYDCVAWGYLSGFPWLPVYVFDPFRLQPELENLGNRHAEVLEEARLHADTYRIVYYFGSHNFGLHKTPHLTMRKWGCPEHDAMCFPNPHKSKRSSFRGQVKKALAEAEVFLACSERIRLLPKMVSTDMLPLAVADRLRAEAASAKSQNAPRHKPTRRPSQPSTQSPVRLKPSPSPSKARPAPSKPPTPTKPRVSKMSIPSDESGDDSDSKFEKLLLKQDKKLASKEKKTKKRPKFDLVPYNSLAWALLEGYPWLPVYVLDPFTLKPDLHLLGNGHRGSLRKAQQYPDRYRIVYYFSSHNFGLHLHPETTLRPWNCPEHATFATGFPKTSCRGKKVLEDLIDGVKEAECFAAANPRTRCLPYMVPSDTDPSLTPPSAQFVPFNSLAWAITEGFPWMPVYVFNPFQLRFKLLNLGSGHRDLLRRARASPEECRIVFYFGSHSFGIHKLDGTLKPWNCPEHSQYLEAKADSLLYMKKSVMDQFDSAMDDVEAFSAMDESNRLLPFMDPSDFEDDATAAAAMSQWQAPKQPGPVARPSEPPVSAARTRVQVAPLVRSRDLSPLRRRPAKRLRLSDDDPVVKRVDVVASHQKASEVKSLFESKMAWVHWGDDIWWPVYICSPKPVLHYAWGPERHMAAINYANVFVEVYHFGAKCYVEHPLSKLRPWGCSDHDKYVEAARRCDDEATLALVQAQFKDALAEAEDHAEAMAKTAAEAVDEAPSSPIENADADPVEYLGEPEALTSEDEDSGDDLLNEEGVCESSDDESGAESDD